MDLFNSNKVIIDFQDIYDEKESLVWILLYAHKYWLPVYDEDDFWFFQFQDDEVLGNIELGSNIFTNEVNYLKGN
jgi:hypothetical protein